MPQNLVKNMKLISKAMINQRIKKVDAYHSNKTLLDSKNSGNTVCNFFIIPLGSFSLNQDSIRIKPHVTFIINMPIERGIFRNVIFCCLEMKIIVTNNKTNPTIIKNHRTFFHGVRLLDKLLNLFGVGIIY